MPCLRGGGCPRQGTHAPIGSPAAKAGAANLRAIGAERSGLAVLAGDRPRTGLFWQLRGFEPMVGFAGLSARRAAGVWSRQGREGVVLVAAHSSPRLAGQCGSPATPQDGGLAQSGGGRNVRPCRRGFYAALRRGPGSGYSRYTMPGPTPRPSNVWSISRPAALSAVTTADRLSALYASARIGQARTHVGSHPRATSSQHPSHLAATPSGNITVAPKGHASTQASHPVHSLASIVTRPDSSLEIASTGHASTQGGWSQWKQCMTR